MRKSRPVTFLLAFAMAVALLSASLSASAQTNKEILLPFTFNEVEKGEAAVMLQGDDVFLSVADLQRAGVTGPMWHRLLAFASLVSGARKSAAGKEFISLKAMAPFLTFKFDEANLSLSVTAEPRLLPSTQVNVQLTPPSDIVYSHDTSTFLNYSVTDTSAHHPTFFGETGTSIGGNLLLNSFSRTADRDFVRLLSSYEIDQRARLQRWTFGDASVTTDVLGGSALVGGVTLARNFNLDPYFVRYPPLDLRGTALTPSRVEVYVNGALVSQQEVPPGPFELNNIPVASGAGNARIVVRDAFGREQVLSQPFYYSTGVLEPGLSEFTYSVGAVRQNFGTKSFDYTSPALLAVHRYGFSDTLTAGGRLEATRDLISGGPSANWRTRAGEFDAGVAVSRDHGSSGTAEGLGYSYLARYFSIGGLARLMSRDYANLSLRREADRPLLDSNVFATLLLAHANLSLMWSESHLRDSPDISRVTLLSNVPITRRSSVFVSVGSANDGSGRRAEFFAGLSIFLGGSTAASITVDHRDGQTQTVTEIDKTLPVGTGFGYRLTGAAADGGSHVGSGLLQYQTDFGRYEMQFDPFQANVRPTVTAAGGLVYQGGALLATRPVQDSFALVQVPGVKNVRVYASNNEVGKTDANGDLLVPNLLPYYGNRLSIQDSDVPLNYEVQDVEKTIAPPHRGGALVVFPVHQIRTVTGTLSVRGAKREFVPAFGELTLTARGTSVQSPLGRGGEFYFENIAAGTWDALIETHEGSCRFRLKVPAGTDPVVKLGHMTCTNEAIEQ